MYMQNNNGIVFYITNIMTRISTFLLYKPSLNLLRLK